MALQGVGIAFSDNMLAATPTWTRIDDPTLCAVQGWTIDRGRAYELDRPQTGTATIDLIDTKGVFDPTNTTGPFYGLAGGTVAPKLGPMRQAGIALQNPVSGSWSTIFRGFIESWDYTLDVSEKFFRVHITLVDALDFLANQEIVPGSYGGSVPVGSEGNAVYLQQNCDDRIKAALADAGWPSGLSNIFSGNVVVQQRVYPPRTSILSVIYEAADAEWPGVANFFVAKDGTVTFHGRLARFNPSNVTYGLNHWACGDVNGCTTYASTAPISAFSMSRDVAKVINAAHASPLGIASKAIAGQTSTDASSITAYGVRSWSADNLITQSGLETGLPLAKAETKKFSDYYKNNYSTPRTRVPQVQFRSQPVSSAWATALWNLMCGVEISDTMTVTTSHPGGGFFNLEPFFVEGVHYQAKAMSPQMHDITLTLDLSPQSYFTSNPF